MREIRPSEVELWCRVAIIDDEDAAILVCTLEGPHSPDLTTVDVIAHLGLLAAKLHGHIDITNTTPELRELLKFAGLFIEMER